jgi:hypothetical protein
MIASLVFFIVELQIVFDRTAWVCGLVVQSRGNSGCNGPEGDEDGDGGEDGEEKGRVETAVDLAGKPQRDRDEETAEHEVVEGVSAGGVGRERGIFDCRILYVR